MQFLVVFLGGLAAGGSTATAIVGYLLLSEDKKLERQTADEIRLSQAAIRSTSRAVSKDADNLVKKIADTSNKVIENAQKNHLIIDKDIVEFDRQIGIVTQAVHKINACALSLNDLSTDAQEQVLACINEIDKFKLQMEFFNKQLSLKQQFLDSRGVMLDSMVVELQESQHNIDTTSQRFSNITESLIASEYAEVATLRAENLSMLARVRELEVVLAILATVFVDLMQTNAEQRDTINYLRDENTRLKQIISHLSNLLQDVSRRDNQQGTGSELGMFRLQ